MKGSSFLLSLLVFFSVNSLSSWSLFNRKKVELAEEATSSVSFDIESNNAEKYSKIKSFLLCCGNNPLLIKVGKVIAQDLDFTDQFEVELKKTDQDVSKIKTSKLFKQGISLLLSLCPVGKEKDNVLTVRLTIKDTSSNDVLFNKTSLLNESTILKKSHELSAKILKIMTGDSGVCLSYLAYCKMLSSRHKIICVADYACNKERVVVDSKSINVAPSWHTKAPVLFYSQITNSNNRLMSVDLSANKHHVVCSYQGLNMQPSFSADGTRAIICLSGGRGNSELYWYDQKKCKRMGRRVFRQLTQNGAHNVSPCMLPDENAIFCSDYETGMPQIYYLDTKARTARRLTGGKGYSAAPSYCAKNNMLVYTRPVNGIFQLFTISLDDIGSIKEKQITFGFGNKHEPSWSPCGHYIVFSSDDVDKNGSKTPQIAVLNVRGGKIRRLTSSHEPKSFPRWCSEAVFRGAKV